MAYVPRLITTYREQIIPGMMEKFGYKNLMEVPKVEKVCLNMGVGEAIQDPKYLDQAVEDMKTIAGQAPAITKARMAVSNFRLRAGLKVGCRTTLRKDLMYEFLDRFINIAIPRIRDFRGLPDKSFDGRGNYSIGIKEQAIFPEINVDTMDYILGMDITIVTTAETDKEAYELLSLFGMPFRKQAA